MRLINELRAKVVKQYKEQREPALGSSFTTLSSIDNFTSNGLSVSEEVPKHPRKLSRTMAKDSSIQQICHGCCPPRLVSSWLRPSNLLVMTFTNCMTSTNFVAMPLCRVIYFTHVQLIRVCANELWAYDWANIHSNFKISHLLSLARD